MQLPKKANEQLFTEVLEMCRKLLSIREPISNDWKDPGIMFVIKSLPQSGYIMLSFSKFKRGKYSFSLELKPPKLEADIQALRKLLQPVIKEFPSIEFYFEDDNPLFDQNNCCTYDYHTHKILNVWEKKYENLVEHIIKMLLYKIDKSTNYNFYKSQNRKPDYDFIYQNL